LKHYKSYCNLVIMSSKVGLHSGTWSQQLVNQHVQGIIWVIPGKEGHGGMPDREIKPLMTFKWLFSRKDFIANCCKTINICLGCVLKLPLVFHSSKKFQCSPILSAHTIYKWWTSTYWVHQNLLPWCANYWSIHAQTRS